MGSKQISILCFGFILTVQASWAVLSSVVNYGAPTVNEQQALDKINRFRSAPQSELSAMFSESFAGTYTNTDMQTLLEGQAWSSNFWANTFGGNIASWSMDFYQTSPGTLYSQFQGLSSASALSWNDNIGWAAYQYATWVERDEGTTSNPHSIPGAPGLGDRFSNAGVNWTGIGENIAADWPMNVNLMHMGFAVDWGPGTDGIQSPPGHRNSMLNGSFNSIGIGLVDDGWTGGDFTQVQHLATVSSTDPIVYGFAFDENGDPLAGVEVDVYDSSSSIIGSAMSDAIGAYTVILSGGDTPETAVYSDGALTSDALTLGSENGNWFLDVQMVPEPSIATFVILLSACLPVLRRRPHT